MASSAVQRESILLKSALSQLILFLIGCLLLRCSICIVFVAFRETVVVSSPSAALFTTALRKGSWFVVFEICGELDAWEDFVEELFHCSHPIIMNASTTDSQHFGGELRKAA